MFFLMELAVPQELIATAIRRRTATTDNTFFFIALFILGLRVNNCVNLGITGYKACLLTCREQFERSLDGGWFR